MASDEPTAKRIKTTDEDHKEPSSCDAHTKWALMSLDERQVALKKADVAGLHSPAVAKIIGYALDGVMPSFFGALIAGFLGPLNTEPRWQPFAEWHAKEVFNNGGQPIDVGAKKAAAKHFHDPFSYPSTPIYDNVLIGMAWTGSHTTMISHYINPWSYLDKGDKAHYNENSVWDRTYRAFGQIDNYVFKTEETILARARKGDVSAKHLEQAYECCNVCSAPRLPLVCARVFLGRDHCRARGDKPRPFLKMTPDLLRTFCTRCTKKRGEPNGYAVRNWADAAYVHPNDDTDNWCFGRTELYAECVLFAIEESRKPKAAAAARIGKAKPKARKRQADDDGMTD